MEYMKLQRLADSPVSALFFFFLQDSSTSNDSKRGQWASLHNKTSKPFSAIKPQCVSTASACQAPTTTPLSEDKKKGPQIGLSKLKKLTICRFRLHRWRCFCIWSFHHFFIIRTTTFNWLSAVKKCYLLSGIRRSRYRWLELNWKRWFRQRIYGFPVSLEGELLRRN